MYQHINKHTHRLMSTILAFFIIGIFKVEAMLILPYVYTDNVTALEGYTYTATASESSLCLIEEAEMSLYSNGDKLMPNTKIEILQNGDRIITINKIPSNSESKKIYKLNDYNPNWWWRKPKKEKEPIPEEPIPEEPIKKPDDNSNVLLERVLLGERYGWDSAVFSSIDDPIIGGLSHSEFNIDSSRGIFSGELIPMSKGFERYSFAAQHAPVDWKLELFHGIGIKFNSDKRTFTLGLIVEIPPDAEPPISIPQEQKNISNESDDPYKISENLRIGYVHKFEGSYYDTTVFLNWTDFHVIDEGPFSLNTKKVDVNIDPVQIVGLALIIRGSDNLSNIKAFKLNINYISGIVYL